MSALEVKLLLEERGWMLATAESCTGGMIAAALTDVPGSSAVFDRGFITYSNPAKIETLGVKIETLAAHGAVSEPVVAEMAEGSRARSRAYMSIAVSGIAGPGPAENTPEGRVCFGLSFGSDVATETVDFGARGRDAVRRATVEHALALILLHAGDD